MDPKQMSRNLGRSGAAIAALVDGVPDETMRRRPAPDRWSPLEILCHLVDEERDDFGARLRSTLEDPTAEWPPIDPQAWVEEHGYSARMPGPVLASCWSSAPPRWPGWRPCRRTTSIGSTIIPSWAT